MKQVKVINNIHSGLGFQTNARPESFRVLSKYGVFTTITEEELEFIFINQKIIQKGMLWIDDVELRIKYGIEKPTGEKVNVNVLQYDEILKLVSGNYKALEKALSKIDEKAILLQFIEAARELNLDSKTKIDMIEDKVKVKIFPEKE